MLAWEQWLASQPDSENIEDRRGQYVSENDAAHTQAAWIRGEGKDGRLHDEYVAKIRRTEAERERAENLATNTALDSLIRELAKAQRRGPR